MLSKNNQVLARHAKADHQQRWALRKLTIGVASVLLGGTLLVINGTPVAADQVNPENATTVKSEPEMSNTKQDAENVVTLASTASDRPAVNATSGEQSPAGVGAEAMLATPAASPALSDPSVTPPQQPAALASDASGQMQPAVTKLQAPEMGWRKPEDSDRTVSYYVIVREVTLVKPDGEEVVMPLLPLRKGQVWDTLDYLDKEENDKLPLIHFDPIKVAPITGAKAPVIPAISQSVHSFLTTDLDKIEISYVIPPVQRTGMEVTPLPYGPEYDEIYDKIYDQYEDKATEYEKKIEAEGRKFGYLDVLLLKETYEYIWVEEKTITRTIHVHLPNGEVQTTKQPVTLERKYTSVAGSDEKKYGLWTVGRWESFTAPEQEGYTALSGSVDEAKVTSESLDAVVDIYYRADEAVIESGKEEKTITRTIHVHLPNGEVQTTKQPVTLVRQYTSVAGSDEKNYGPWNTGQWDAFTAPEQAGYTALPDSVAEVEVTSESLDAVVDIYYRADEAVIESGQEEKTITRTIHVHLPNGEVQTTKQPVTLERKYTSVAGSEEKKYGPWTVGRWESFTAPEQTGYTALPGSVAEIEVTSESLDAVVDIYYRADDPAIVAGKEEKTITRTIHVHLPNGEVQTTKQPVTLERKYTSVAGNDEKKYGPWTIGRWESFTTPEQAGYTALPDSVAEVEVTSESLDAVVDIYYRADEAVIESGQEEKTITRTINVHLPNGEVQTTKQPVTLERKYTSVAGNDEKKYGPWTVGRWESFTTPEQTGYTALPGNVAEIEVTSESLDAVVDIYYRADDPAIVAGKEEKTITRTINVHLPNGEVQTTKQPVTLEREYTSVVGSDEKKYGPWTVGRWESFTAPEQTGYTALPGNVAEVEVTSESLDAVVDIYYRADDPAIVAGKEEKTITRTINVHLPNGEVQTTKQPVTLERKYTSVAGNDEKKYGPWTIGRWESFTTPEQAGYTALPDSVAEVEVTSESLDAVVDIYYRADEAVIESGQEEKTITRTINVHLPNGEVQTTKQPVTLTRTYTKVNGQTKYSEWTTGTWDSFTAPEQTGYTALPGSVAEVEVISESLDAVVDIYYRADEPAVVEGKEEKTITRTINVHLPNGEVQTTKQPVTLERKYTSVAGSDEKKYGPWTVGRWDSFTAPEQAGYTALPGSVAEVEVTSESLDAVVDIYYRADDPTVVEGKEEKTITRTINVHLPNDEVQTTKQPVTLERKYTSVAGSGEKKYGPWTAGRWESFTAPEQEGYTALPGSVAEVEVTSESLDAVVDIYYRADEAVIESGQEEKTITRTINVHLPNGEVQTTTQPVTLVREYTGVAGSDEKNYGPWNTGQWNAFTAPELAGYTAMPGSVASVEVTSESLDVVVDIYYRIDIPPKVEVGPDPEQPTTDPDPEQPTTDPDPEQPTTDPDPEQPMTDPDPEQPMTDPDPEQPMTDPDPEQPTTDPDPEQPTTDPDPEQPTTDPDPEQPTTDPDPEQPTTDPDPERPIGHPVAPAIVAPDQQANLPQTGNATSSLVALLGVTLATFLGSLLLLGKRKR